MNTIVTPTLPLSQAGSLTPELEGAPCSASHPDRMKSVTQPSPTREGDGKEGFLSKP